MIAISCDIKNIAGRFFGLVTKHACDGQTDGQNDDSQDRASIARAVKNDLPFMPFEQFKLISNLVNAGWP